MNIIFLDIDGVLNFETHYENVDKDIEYPYNQFNYDAIKRLNKICDETNAKIVLSTSWRFDKDIINLLRHVGITSDIIGKTKYLVENHNETLTHVDRGYEIQDYIDNNTECVDNYIIIDDDCDMLSHQLPHHVQTSWYDGLSETKMIEAINKLQKNI